jgi:hypothetical protein
MAVQARSVQENSPGRNSPSKLVEYSAPTLPQVDFRTTGGCRIVLYRDGLGGLGLFAGARAPARVRHKCIGCFW